MGNIQEENYKKLEELGFLEVIEHKYIGIDNYPYLRFTIEVIWENSPTNFRIAMDHWTEQNGDLMHDPDMECVIDTEAKTISARTYQLDGAGVYDTAERDGEIDTKLAADLDEFLALWLGNLKDQGFGEVYRNFQNP